MFKQLGGPLGSPLGCSLGGPLGSPLGSPLGGPLGDAGTIDRRRNRNWIEVRRNNVRIEKGPRRQRQKEQRQNNSFGMIQFE